MFKVLRPSVRLCLVLLFFKYSACDINDQCIGRKASIQKEKHTILLFQFFMLQSSSTGSRTRTSRFVDNYIASTTIDLTRKSFCSTTFSSFQPYLPIISFWCFKQMLQQQNPLLIKLDLIHCHLFWVGTAAFLSDFIFNCLFVIL